MDVRTRVRSYFGKAIRRELADEDDIFDLGVVDSLFAMQLVLFVENEFGVAAEREDLDIRNFCSIAAVAGFVTRKLERTAQIGRGRGSAAV